MRALPSFFATLVVLLTCLLLPGRMAANNLQVTNAALTGNNGSLGQCFVQFDLSWQHGWRGSGMNNWDAAWVFMKYRTASGNWYHVHLGNTGHVLPAGVQVDAGLLNPNLAHDPMSNPVVGTFVRRDSDGLSFSASGIQLKWNYVDDGLSISDILEVRVFGIEMVHVTQGPFHVGSGGTESNSFTNGSWTAGSTIPLQVTSESAIGLAQTAGNLWATGSITTGTLPAAYPKGYRSFYAMKYELSQQQYVDFLNTLTRAQQDARTATSLASGVTSVTNRYVMSNTSTMSARNGIRCDATINGTQPITFYCDAYTVDAGGGSFDGQWGGCNWLAWGDLAAYLDWSGLRPMTDLEFEKSCRGGLPPVAGEYPWGNTTIAASSYSAGLPFAANETIASNFNINAGNCCYVNTCNTIAGPVRVGIFAGNSSNTGRTTSGAGYPGVMELAGNLSECVVNATTAAGQAYAGAHGDGTLTAAGTHDASTWPGITGDGTGVRGGSWSTSNTSLRTSDRSAAGTPVVNRSNTFGGRGARTAP